VESVLVINPGTLSKRKGAGTYAQMAIHPRVLTDEERQEKSVGHKLFERARVDVVRI
jgi:DNA polymerase alpha subunit B